MVEPRRARRMIAEERKDAPVIDLVGALRSLIAEAAINHAAEKEAG